MSETGYERAKQIFGNEFVETLLRNTEWVVTKRELFAAMAMQGLLSAAPISTKLTYRDVADEAVTYTDALIAALEAK